MHDHHRISVLFSLSPSIFLCAYARPPTYQFHFISSSENDQKFHLAIGEFGVRILWSRAKWNRIWKQRNAFNDFQMRGEDVWCSLNRDLFTHSKLQTNHEARWHTHTHLVDKIVKKFHLFEFGVCVFGQITTFLFGVRSWSMESIQRHICTFVEFQRCRTTASPRIQET